MDSQPPTEGPSKRRLRPMLIGVFGALALVLGAAAGWYRYTFPYGITHPCSKQLGLGLRMYASEHSGWFPHGKATPERSLAAIEEFVSVHVLAGKHLQPAKLKAILDEKGELGSDSCGWHYVEGLREEDDPGIAIAWDKLTGLGHDGERREAGGREVVFLDGSISYIHESQWPGFVEQQKRLLTEVAAKRETNSPPIRWSDETTLGLNKSKPETQQ